MNDHAVTTDAREPMDNEIKDDVLCPCADFRRSDLRRTLAANPNLSFDDLLLQTGAGGTCTACLLDLEYYFTVLPRDRTHSPTGPSSQRRRDETISLKHRFYGLIDSLSPASPMPLTEYMPVLFGNGVEEWVCIANHSILYQQSACAPDIEFKLLVRDAGGHKLHRETRVIAPSSAGRVLVSSHLGHSGTGELRVGSVQVSRRARWPGVRGTTRPQVEIVSEAGSCAVHTQAPGRLRDRWISTYHRPTDERLFASAVNASSAPLVVEIAYPFGSDSNSGIAPSVHNLLIPPYGTILHEIKLPEPASCAMQGKLYSIRFNTSGLGKMHLFCATPNLDRFSIDHL